MGKLSIRVILSRYLSTLYRWDDGKKRVSKTDVLIQLVAPVLLGFIAVFLGFRFEDLSNLIAGVSIVSALLGAVAVFLFQTRLQLYDSMYSGNSSGGTIFDERDISVLDELFFSVLWCIFEGMVICTILIVSDSAGLIGRASEFDLMAVLSGIVLSGIVVIAGCNLVLVLLMCLKRMGRIYERFGMHISKENLSR